MNIKRIKYHYFYKTVCFISNRYYYGMHSTCNLQDGYLGSGKILRYSINKYGKENHKLEILEFFKTKEDLRKKEIEFVNEDFLKDPLCMNLQPGGGGGFSLEQQKINAVKSNKKQNYLRKTDKVWADSVSLHISLGNKQAYKNGRISAPPDWSGKKHKDETKIKIGKANTISQKGEKNSQYGTCWITNGKQNKKIKKDNEIPDDWKLGRKLNGVISVSG